MDINQTLSVVEFFVKFVSMASCTIAVGYKSYQDKKKYGSISHVKLIYLAIFITNLYATIFDDLFYRIGIFPWEWQVELVNIGINTIAIGLMVAFGFMLIFSLLKWEFEKTRD